METSMTGRPAGILDTWTEDDGTEVWLVEPDDGDIGEMAEYARAHATGDGHLVLGANADGAQEPRRTRLGALGFERVFSMVELRRDLSPIAYTPAARVDVRTARADDAPRIHESGVRTWEGRAYFTQPSLESTTSWFERSDLRWFLVAEREEDFLGYVAGVVDGDVITLDDVLVDRNAHRQGIGTQLVSVLISLAGREGLSSVRLMTEGDDPVGARTFYHRLGFETYREDERYRLTLRE